MKRLTIIHQYGTTQPVFFAFTSIYHIYGPQGNIMLSHFSDLYNRSAMTNRTY